MDDLTDMIVRHEGRYPSYAPPHMPYKDTVGKLTIGYGRNLSDRGLSEEEALYLLQTDLDRVQSELNQALPWWVKLDWVRKMVLMDMGYNLGVITPPDKAKLLQFVNTLKAVEEGRYNDAAASMLKSKWAEQVGGRAKELAAMMRTGQYPVKLESVP